MSQAQLEPRLFAQMAKRTASGSYLVRRVDPCRACRVLFQTGNLEWLVKPHWLEIPRGRLSRPVEVVRRVCPCLFQMVQQAKPRQLEIRLERR